MSLVTSCPWCGTDGVSASFKDSEGAIWRPYAYDGSVEIFKDCYSKELDIKELEGQAAVEKVTKLLEQAKKRGDHVEFWCTNGCRHLTRNPSRAVMLLNRVLYGHTASARERVKSLSV